MTPRSQIVAKHPHPGGSSPVLSDAPAPLRRQERTGHRQRSRAPNSTATFPARDGHHAPLDEYFHALFEALGPQKWWPAKTPFEVVVGAILTQNAAWTNVERAITNLRDAGLLSFPAMEKVPLKRLETLVRPSGYFRQKARKLKAFCKFLRGEYSGSLRRMFAEPTPVLREKLLAVFGIGPETADSILLYAGGHGVFVVDAYTKRIMIRHGWAHERTTYDELRLMFEDRFPGHVERYNEFHALIVNTGKNFCRTKQPQCGSCPLGPYLEEGR